MAPIGIYEKVIKASLPSIIVSATWGLAFLKFQNVHFAKTIQIKIVNFWNSSKHGIVIKRVQFEKVYGL